ncbi:hypothetical protein Tco_0561839 [Tanacetum coccineum]
MRRPLHPTTKSSSIMKKTLDFAIVTLFEATTVLPRATAAFPVPVSGITTCGMYPDFEKPVTVAVIVDGVAPNRCTLRYISSTELQIWKRVGAHKLKYPDAKMISLGLGDTAQPIPKVFSSSMAKTWLSEQSRSSRVGNASAFSYRC